MSGETLKRVCKSCPTGWSMDVAYIAHAPRDNGKPPLEWPVCHSHAQMAMVAGWFPLDPVKNPTQ